MKVILRPAAKQLIQLGTKVITPSNEYYYLPYWYRDNKDGTFEQLSFDQLPKDLKETIKELHGLK